jgi:hypothetical protein
MAFALFNTGLFLALALLLPMVPITRYLGSFTWRTVILATTYATLPSLACVALPLILLLAGCVAHVVLRTFEQETKPSCLRTIRGSLYASAWLALPIALALGLELLACWLWEPPTHLPPFPLAPPPMHTRVLHGAARVLPVLAVLYAAYGFQRVHRAAWWKAALAVGLSALALWGLLHLAVWLHYRFVLLG